MTARFEIRPLGLWGRPEFIKGYADILANAAGPAPFVDDASVSEARAVIGRLYRRAARNTHADHGGSDAVFRLVGKARDVLLGGTK